MPLYDYECEAGHRYEKRESFGAPAQQPCDQCGKPARRLLNAPPIVFKGSGWYKTDSKRSLRAGVDATDDGDGADEAPAAASTSDDAPATPAKPAKKPKAAKAPAASESTSASTAGADD